MKKTLLTIMALFLMVSVCYAEKMGTYVEVYAVTTQYTPTKVDKDGVTTFQMGSVTPTKNQMGYSGTSPCQVIDLGNMDIDGFFTFQMKSITGTTIVPLGGTTITAKWKGTNINIPSAWDIATANTIFDGINVLTGATNIGYDITDITGVTPFRYFRIEWLSGASKDMTNRSGVTPVGILFIR